MNRQFNFRFFAVLLACGSVLGLVGHQIQKHNVRKNANYLLTQAKQALSQKEYPAAIRHFNHYLTLNPQDALTRARLGVALANQAANSKEVENAYLILEQALRDDPQLEQVVGADPEIAEARKSAEPEVAAQANDLAEVRRTTIRLAIKLRLFGDAVEHIKILLQKQPDDPELLVIRGMCEESANQDERALADYSKAIERDPARIEAYSRMASLFQRRKEPHKADKVVSDMFGDKISGERNQTVPAFLMATAYYLEHNQLPDARTQIEKAKKLEPDDVDVLLATVRVANTEGKLSEAEESLQRGLVKHPERHEFRLGAASQEMEAGRNDRAIDLLRKAEAAITKPSMELWMVADLFITASAWTDAEKALIRLRMAKADSEAIEFLEARLHLGKGSVREAEERLLRCERAFPKNSELALRTQVLLAECYNQSAKPDLQLKAARKAVDMNGTSVPARMALGSALRASGLHEEAKAEYALVATRDPRLRAYLSRLVLTETIRKPLVEQSFEGAMKLLNEAPPELRKHADFVLVDAEVLLFDGAVMLTRGRLTISPGSTEPTAAGKKLVEAGQSKMAEARKRVEEARAANPKETRYWIFLAERAAAEGKPADGLAVLEQAKQAAGDTVDLRLARAALLRPVAGNIQPLVAIEADAASLSELDRTKLYLGLADAHERFGTEGNVERLLRLAHQIQPKNLRILTRLLETVSVRENEADVGALVQPIRDAEGDDGALWRFASAYQQWLACLKSPNPGDVKARVETARKLLAAASESRPKWFRIPLLEGEIADRVGPSDLALEKYKFAFQLGANNPRLVARLTHLLIGRNRQDEAEQTYLEYRRRTGNSTVELDRIEAYNRLMKGSDPEDVIAAIRIPEDSKSVEDQLFRGRIFDSLRERSIESEGKARLAGKNAEAADWKKKAEDSSEMAERAFRKAIELSPSTPQVWISLVRHLVVVGRVDDAKKEVTRAESTVSAEIRHQVLGPCFEAVGDRVKARHHFEAAGPDSNSQRALAMHYLGAGDSEKAVEVLRSLTNAKHDPFAVRWARRTLALSLLASRTDSYAKNLEAEELIKANVAEERGSVDDDRVLAFIHSFRPGGRGESIQKLEALFRRIKPSLPEQFLLARLYELEGDWAAANDRYLGLLSGPGGEDRTFLVPYIQSLLRRKDPRSAEMWVNRLAAKEQDTFALAEIQARLINLQGNKMQAAKSLKEYAAKTFEKKKEPGVLVAAAIVLTDLGLIADAETLYRQYVMVSETITPSGALVLAEFLAQYRNQVVPALEICSSLLSKKVEPDAIARVAVAVVRLGDQVTAAHYAEVERIIQAAAAANPSSLDISISLADLRDAQGRYDEAKALYRSVLARNGRAVLAMNNLAWLLAVQEKKPAEALKMIDEAIRIAGPDGNLLDTRGVILMTGGDLPEALSTLTRAVNDEHTPERLLHLSQAYWKGAKMREAGQAMRQARELGLDKRTKFLHRLELPDYETMNRTFPDDR